MMVPGIICFPSLSLKTPPCSWIHFPCDCKVAAAPVVTIPTRFISNRKTESASQHPACDSQGSHDHPWPITATATIGNAVCWLAGSGHLLPSWAGGRASGKAKGWKGRRGISWRKIRSGQERKLCAREQVRFTTVSDKQWWTVRCFKATECHGDVCK